jgi:hypothetical protein
MPRAKPSTGGGGAVVVVGGAVVVVVDVEVVVVVGRVVDEGAVVGLAEPTHASATNATTTTSAKRERGSGARRI